MDKFQKLFWWSLVILLAICGFFFYQNAVQRATYKSEKKQFEQTLAEREGRIRTLKGKEEMWKDEAAQALARADQSAAESERLRAQMIEKDRENEELKGRVAAMPEDAIAAEFRLRLKMPETDIYRNAAGIQFSLLAARAGLLRMIDADYFTLTKEPLFEQRIAEKEKENGDLRETIADQATALAACDGIKGEWEKIKIDYRRILKKSESQAKWLRFTIGGTAVAVTIAGLVFILKK